ncbi:MAG: XdhC/CoxI family protein [Thermoleophilia bacterium]
MRDLLTTLAPALAGGRRAAIATVVTVYRSAPRGPGAAMALLDDGRIVGSVTGGCVEPDVLEHARQVLDGGPARLADYGIADEDAFAVGMPCGGRIEIVIEPAEPAVIGRIADAVRNDRPVAYVTVLSGPGFGTRRAVDPGDDPSDPLVAAALDVLARGATAVAEVGEDRVLINSLAPRPAMYVFGAIDHAAAVAEIGRFLGYRVTVCDAREAFLTSERFPAADEMVTDWPHRFLAEAPVDARTAICVLTHDARFDVPALVAALATDAGYIGAMGSRRTTERREELLRAEGVTDAQLARIHAPIGLAIGSATPREVAVSVAAEIVRTFRVGPAGPA